MSNQYLISQVGENIRYLDKAYSLVEHFKDELNISIMRLTIDEIDDLMSDLSPVPENHQVRVYIDNIKKLKERGLE